MRRLRGVGCERRVSGGSRVAVPNGVMRYVAGLLDKRDCARKELRMASVHPVRTKHAAPDWAEDLTLWVEEPVLEGGVIVDWPLR